MSKKLFIGNISWSVSQEELAALFSNYQSVEEVILIKDNMSGRSKGFGFVTFTDAAEADDAIKTLNGHDLSGRQIFVNEAQPKEPREGGGGFRSGAPRSGGFNRGGSGGRDNRSPRPPRY